MKRPNSDRWLTRRFSSEQWRSVAACRSAEPDLFFPVSGSASNLPQVAEAKAICARCPVRRQCLAFALRTVQLYGIWGGMTEEERYPLIKARQQRTRSAQTQRRHAPQTAHP